MSHLGTAVATVAVALPFVLGAAALPSAADGEKAFRFNDAEIVESSGLAWVDGLVVTVNDSGDSGRVFAVDPATGETVGTTTWADDPTDVEALAPAGDGEVWVADIGDNAHAREELSVLRVPVGRGDRAVDPTAYTLVFADGPRDAESLLVHPRTGRLYVVSKGVWSGRMYAAPRRLSAERPNTLRAIGEVLPVATDGAFLNDGRHLVLRSYLGGAVYSFPELELVADLDLPAQQQGEGVAVTPEDELLLSSEGLHQWVLRVTLPVEVRGQRPGSTGDADAEPGGGEEPADGSTSGDRWVGLLDRDAWPVWLGGATVLAAATALVRWVRRRPRS